MSRYSGPEYEFEERAANLGVAIMVLALLLCIIAICGALLSGCASTYRAGETGPPPDVTLQTARPEARLPPALEKGRDVSARPPHQWEWEAGALRAAEVLGCERATWQLPGETFQQAAAVYASRYTPGDCLILTPHHGGADYFLGYAGQFDGCECGPLIPEWPGTPVYYLRDTPYPVFI